MLIMKVLAKAANIVRCEILDCLVRFEGTFDKSNQKASVPKASVTLLSMIMNGSSLTLKANYLFTRLTSGVDSWVRKLFQDIVKKESHVFPCILAC